MRNGTVSPDRRAYHATRTQVNADGVSWTTVYTSTVSGEYLESAAGKTFTFSRRPVRYVRDYLNGSNINANNHWSEIEVWGEAPSDLISAYVGNYYEWSPRASVKYYYAGGRRVAIRAGSQAVKYLLGDHLGSTSVTVDANGNRVAELRYEPWGETRYSSGTTPTTFHYTGQREEKGLGLYFYGARWYDPLLSRFVQADTIIPEASQGTQAWDRYAYTNNNPLVNTDPTGHMAIADGDQSDQCSINKELCSGTMLILDLMIRSNSRTISLRADREFYRNLAIDLAIKVYDLELPEGTTISYEDNLEGAGVTGRTSGHNIEIGKGAFDEPGTLHMHTPGWLGSTIGHEGIHVKQNEMAEKLGLQDDITADEIEAYKWELAHASDFGLRDDEIYNLISLLQIYLPSYPNSPLPQI